MAIYDFGGYATKANLKCSDGRVIMPNAFKANDGQKVPLVWQHQRNEPTNVLGHALLENREDGVYCYCKFNETNSAKQAKQLVEHGDITSLSIYANQLSQQGRNVTHGQIREVSLVLAGANPGALIDNLAISHSDGSYEPVDDEAYIYTGLDLEHSVEYEEEDHIEHAEDENQNGGDSEETAEDVFNTLNQKQKNLVYAMVGYALGGDEEDDDEAEHSDEGGEEMKTNVFDQTEENTQTNSLSHEDKQAIFANARKYGSLKQAVQDFALEHSIVGTGAQSNQFPEDILFPEARSVTPTPEMIMRQQEWVSKVWNATRKSPFSRIKSVAADITGDEARARGYIKGKKKKEEVIAMLKRVTTPQTVYKLQKMDRDDIIDITDFDVVAWLKAEMRLMLNEELARAILVGDGREAGDDKINETNIRPVWTDDDLYTIKQTVKFSESATDDEKASQLIKAVHYSRIDYRGSGSPTLYIDSHSLTMLLLAEDKIGRRLYNTVTELATALRVREIVEVPVFDNLERDGRSGVPEESGKKYKLRMLIVNLTDYNVGADRGGAVAMFDDFDIDYNKYTYLIETRCSGALIRPFSAIAIEEEVSVG